jgi:hypothetical protein
MTPTLLTNTTSTNTCLWWRRFRDFSERRWRPSYRLRRIVGLAGARQKAKDALRTIDDGKDPTRAGRARLQAETEANVLTFGRAVDLYLAKVAQPYKNAKNDHARERGLRVVCAPPSSSGRAHHSARHRSDTAVPAAGNGPENAVCASRPLRLRHGRDGASQRPFPKPSLGRSPQSRGILHATQPRPSRRPRLPANARVHASPRGD